MMSRFHLPICEAIATAFLLIAIVGSGIAAERLSGGNVALALLVNALATGGALFALIMAFASWSGAHMNPLVTVMLAVRRQFPWRNVPAHLLAQLAGAVVGVWLAHVMFSMPVLEIGQHARGGVGQWIAEVVATFGLLAIIEGAAPRGVPGVAGAVATYIAGAYWFTSSTSFANPAVTIARALTVLRGFVRSTFRASSSPSVSALSWSWRSCGATEVQPTCAARNASVSLRAALPASAW